MSNVVQLNCVTRLDLDPDRTLENLKGQLGGFIIAGYTPEGEEFFASTYADGGDALWLVERFKLTLLTIGNE
jgi:hypothetical protein